MPAKQKKYKTISIRLTLEQHKWLLKESERTGGTPLATYVKQKTFGAKGVPKPGRKIKTRSKVA